MKNLLPLLLLFLGATLSAQNLLEVRRVELDSLVRFLDREFPERFYCVKDAAAQASFSVSAPREAFVEQAFDALREKGYTVSCVGGNYFILRGKTIFAGLPTGYFADGSEAGTEDVLGRYLAEQNTQASFQNKVYEIGDERGPRVARAYVSGHVRDASDGEPLSGVSVYDEGGRSYAVTDADGFYRVSLPSGEQQLNFSGYALDDLHLTLRVWGDGALDVTMKEKVTALAAAVVSADAVSRHRDTRLGLERVRMEVINKIPSAFGEGDVIRAVLTLPGVKSVGEASSGFNVRGGSTDQNLVLFNGCTIYNPTHLFGIFSAFNPDIVSEAELYKSAIPAEYGGRISSVLDVRTRDGNANKVGGSLGLGLLTSRFLLEGPLVQGKTSFLAAGRATYSNWMLGLLPKESEYAGGRASFGDINVGLTHKVDENNSLQGFFYWSRDGFSFSHDLSYLYGNLNASLRWRHRRGSRLDVVTSLGYDQYAARMEDTLGDNELSGYRVDTRVQQMFAKASAGYGLNEKHRLSFGANLILYRLLPGESAPLSATSLVAHRSLPLQTALEPALFLSDTWTPDPKLSVEAGVRFGGLLSFSPAKTYFSPEFRLSAKYSFLDNLTIKAGVNTLTQYIHLISNTSSITPIDGWQLSNADIPPQTGLQVAGGLYWTEPNGLVEWSLEAYYKRMSHHLDYKAGAELLMNEHLSDDLVGTYGKAWGVELMARKTSGKLTGWIAGSYSRTWLREMQDRGAQTLGGGEWYPAAHDKPLELKIYANYKFTHRYSLSANLEYATGRPVTLPVGWYEYGGKMRLAYSQRNACRIPDYFRFDLAINIDPGHYLKRLTHMMWTIGVYNVTARRNAYSLFYRGSESYMLSVFACPIPYVNLSLKF